MNSEAERFSHCSRYFFLSYITDASENLRQRPSFIALLCLARYWRQGREAHAIWEAPHFSFSWYISQGVLGSSPGQRLICHKCVPYGAQWESGPGKLPSITYAKKKKSDWESWHALNIPGVSVHLCLRGWRGPNQKVWAAQRNLNDSVWVLRIRFSTVRGDVWSPFIHNV